VSRVAGTRGRVLYLSHNGLTEPLGRRQVLPYLVGLSTRGWLITVISFEKKRTATAEAVGSVERQVRAASILWEPLRYHNRPAVAATAYDIICGCLRARRLSQDVQLVHARSTVPALMASFVSKRRRVPWIFDLRGMIAEEYVDAGQWPRGGVRHRVTAAVEERLLQSADGVVTLTRRILERLPVADDVRPSRPTTVIPCSVDLGTFRPSEEWRREVRASLGWGDEPALVYAGSLGSWYRLGEMLDFFAVVRRQITRLRFLILTPQVALAEREVLSRRLGGDVLVRSVTPDAVPRHLTACDAGICFLGHHASKDASSPTKYGEYLAAGLPVITNSWVGDAAVLSGEPPWLLVDAFAEEEYRRTAIDLANRLREPAITRLAARELARREFALAEAITRYHELYQRVLGR
jgi:glycosyltransferase involved in cell wall biosynthesis